MGKGKRNRERRRSVATDVSTSRRRNPERTVITPGGVEMTEGLARLAGLAPPPDDDERGT